MTSVTEICNRALTILERKRITDILDGSPSANDCLAVYDPTRKDLLRSMDWNFARGVEKLAQIAGEPIAEWDHAYQLPSDWLQTLRVSDNDNLVGHIPYEIIGDQIRSSAEEIYLKYTKDIEDTALFDASFATALSWEVATQIARTLAEQEMVETKRRGAKGNAGSRDAIEDYPKRRPIGSWVATRFRSGRNGNVWRA